MSSILVVQHIQYQMSKDQKRVAGLADLCRAPETKRIPMKGLDLHDGSVLQHVLHSGMTNASVPSERILQTGVGGLPLTIGGVTIYRTEEQARVEFFYSFQCGAPDRGWARQTFVVSRGEWAQVCYNGRFSGYEDYWYYEKTVVNVAVSPAPSENIFLDKGPDYRYHLMSRLK